MKTVVITGSTRGIGYSLAEAFLARECDVVVTGRSENSVNTAVATLAARFGQERVLGHPCDVTVPAQVENLCQAAETRFGQVDIWISNAGLGHRMANVWELSPETVRSVVDTNLTGVVNCARVAIPRFLAQGHGQLYNMEGYGSDLSVRAKLGIYAATKAAVRSLTLTLAKETAGMPIQIGALGPGMVVTDLLLDPVKDDPKTKAQLMRVTNILGERPETVSPWLAEHVLGNTKTGVRFDWLTTPKVIWKFATAPFHKRDLFSGDSV